MSRTKDAGDRGEAAAARYLLNRGCEVLDRQWRCRYGELDLVARTKEGVLCLVEVKLRSSRSAALPREFVDARKQERLRKTAMAYLTDRGWEDEPVRFDVAEVWQDGDGGIRLEYLPAAFE